jgi:glycosyltransferase involved in cell wall biosynthesis
LCIGERLRILHLNNEKTWRGGERQTLLLAAELQKMGVQNAIACRRDSPLEARAIKESVPVIHVGASNPLLLANLLALAPKYDLLHCHTGRGHSVAAIQSVFNRTPLLVTRRVDFLPRRSIFNRFKFSRARKVVCISQFIATQMRDWGLPKEKLVIIPSAVPLPDAKISRDAVSLELRRRLNISADKKLIGNIAAMVGHKDQATLLRAARHVVDKRPNAAIVIIGDGELRPQLEQQRRELHLEQFVYFAGFIPDAEKFLPAFDVFAMSSCMEGLGSIVLDAFAAGVPVAATAGGGLPELVRQRDTGLLAPIGDDRALARAVLDLLSSPSMAAELTQKARDFVAANFSVHGMAEQYRGIYQSLVMSRAAGAPN